MNTEKEPHRQISKQEEGREGKGGGKNCHALSTISDSGESERKDKMQGINGRVAAAKSKKNRTDVVRRGSARKAKRIQPNNISEDSILSCRSLHAGQARHQTATERSRETSPTPSHSATGIRCLSGKDEGKHARLLRDRDVGGSPAGRKGEAEGYSKRYTVSKRKTYSAKAKPRTERGGEKRDGGAFFTQRKSQGATGMSCQQKCREVR